MANLVSITDEAGFMRTLRRLAHEILENTANPENIILAGIIRRGAVLADLLADMMKEISGIRPAVETLDITFYRDDLSEAFAQPTVKSARFNRSPEGMTVVLVDDVIYTGRTSRAAMDAVMDLGRAACIRLAVMVDRGHRELPIRPDYVGKNVPTSREEVIKVLTEPYDGRWGVELLKP